MFKASKINYSDFTADKCLIYGGCHAWFVRRKQGVLFRCRRQDECRCARTGATHWHEAEDPSFSRVVLGAGFHHA